MRVFLAEFSNASTDLTAIITKHKWGRMWSSRLQKVCYEGEPHAFDNGAWACYAQKKPFDHRKFNKRLKYLETLPTLPYLCVCPDIVAAGLQSLYFSVHAIVSLPKKFPWYLAVQDGMKPEHIDGVMSKFSGIFIGGTNEFKSTDAWDFVEYAKPKGIPIHLGRCGTADKVYMAHSMGVDSIDSATPVKALVMGAEHRYEMFEKAVFKTSAQYRIDL